MARQHSVPPKTATPAGWSRAARGAVRVAVVVGSVVGVVGAVQLADPAELDADPALWLVIVGSMAAGLASSARALAVPLVPTGARLATMGGEPSAADRRGTDALSRPFVRDAGWSLLLVGGAFALRTIGRVVAGAPALELLLPLLVAVIWFTAYLVGLLVAFSAGSAVRLVSAHRRGDRVAWEWWAVPVVFLALVVFAVTALLSVTVLDAPSSRGLGGFLGLILWDFHDLEGWDLALAWTTRLSGLAVVGSIGVLIAGRVRGARGASKRAVPDP